MQDSKEKEINVNVCGKSLPGGGKSVRTTEDHHLIYHIDQLMCAVVADGHGGANGKLAAEYATDAVVEWTKKNSFLIPTWSYEMMRRETSTLFIAIHNKFRYVLQRCEYEKRGVDKDGVVRRYHSGEPIHGGTTLSCCWFFLNQNGQRVVHSANVGDSDIVLVKKDKSNDTITYEHLSVTHSPDNQDEYVRIQTSELPSKLMCVYTSAVNASRLQYPQIFHPIMDAIQEKGCDLRDKKYIDDPLYQKELVPTNLRYEPGVYAISPYGAKDSVAIAMTRSIGDYHAHQYGLTAEPSQKSQILDDDSEHIVFLGSDGVWDCYVYQDFAERSMKYISAECIVGTVNRLVDDTVMTALSRFGTRYDDITLIGVQFLG